MYKLSNSQAEEQVVIFLHIPKTAGTTLRYITQYQCQPSTIYEIYGQKANLNEHLETLKNLPDAEKRKIKIVNAHSSFGLHTLFPQPYTYITFLRNPIDRVLSHYRYLCSTRGKKFQDKTLISFVDTWGGARNHMTKYLSGENVEFRLVESGSEDYLCTQEHLELAKRNLKNHFKVVGLTERFDESLMLLKRILGWKIPLYEKSKVSKKQYSASPQLKEAIGLIEKYNELDIQLYDYAKELFENLIVQQDSSFAKEVEAFKLANQTGKFKYYFQACTTYNRFVNRVYKELARH